MSLESILKALGHLSSLATVGLVLRLTVHGGFALPTHDGGVSLFTVVLVGSLLSFIPEDF